jgi:hypothetical protein
MFLSFWKFFLLVIAGDFVDDFLDKDFVIILTNIYCTFSTLSFEVALPQTAIP